MIPFFTPDESNSRLPKWNAVVRRLCQAKSTLKEIQAQQISGRLLSNNGIIMKAEGCRLATGQRCLIEDQHGEFTEAEVVGFEKNVFILMPIEHRSGLSPGARVTPLGQQASIAVGSTMLGRIMDGVGRPIDDKGHIKADTHLRLQAPPINPLLRKPISTPLDTGVRSINSLLTVGQGQRLGLFAGSGVGKSTLLSMMAKNTNADIIILSLVGERGREVKDFIAQTMDSETLQRSIVIVAPADHAPVMRMRAALLSHRIAEYFRDSGHHVLLLMDSLTRYAQARREIGLAVGEPPSSRGYPASAFDMMSRLVERAGNSQHQQGSLTAFYTVLMESENDYDPIADTARAILDGHIVLSQELALSGNYPAIDILSSISRTMPQTVDTTHLQAAMWFRKTLEKSREGHELKALGVYQEGRDPALDQAISMAPAMMAFLQQQASESVALIDSISQLNRLFPASS